MKTEFEATFPEIDRVSLTEKLRAIGGSLERPEFLQRRVTLELPEGRRDGKTWLRVRDEGDKITLTLKSVDGKTIDGQKEITVIVDSIEETVALLEAAGCEKVSYQESKRELWRCGDTEVMIDTWPFLPTYAEIEGPNEEAVRNLAARLDLDYARANFSTVNALYKEKYGKTIEELDRDVLKGFAFAISNPFL